MLRQPDQPSPGVANKTISPAWYACMHVNILFVAPNACVTFLRDEFIHLCVWRYISVRTLGGDNQDHILYIYIYIILFYLFHFIGIMIAYLVITYSHCWSMNHQAPLYVFVRKGSQAIINSLDSRFIYFCIFICI